MYVCGGAGGGGLKKNKPRKTGYGKSEIIIITIIGNMQSAFGDSQRFYSLQ